MRTRWIFIILLLFPLLPINSDITSTDTKRYLPQFSFGARVTPSGPQNYQAASLDWVSLDFSWYEAETGATPWQTLDTLQSLGLNILISVTNPPLQTISTNGPDSLETARLLNELVMRYPNIRAIELYPAANTRAGWGAPPNPQAYRQLFEFTEQYLASQGHQVLLIVGGLSNQGNLPGDIPDVEFLEGLYQAGFHPAITGLRFSGLTSKVFDAPAQNTLLHIEQIREIMLKNGHEDGLLWLTGLELPAAYAYASQLTQAAWLEETFHLLRARLYLGNIFYAALNSCPNCNSTSLVSDLGQPHLFLLRLQSGFPAISSQPNQVTNDEFPKFPEIHPQKTPFVDVMSTRDEYDMVIR